MHFFSRNKHLPLSLWVHTEYGEKEGAKKWWTVNISVLTFNTFDVIRGGQIKKLAASTEPPRVVMRAENSITIISEKFLSYCKLNVNCPHIKYYSWYVSINNVVLLRSEVLMFKTSYKMIVLQVLHVATIESDLGRCKRSKKLSLFMHFSFNF